MVVDLEEFGLFPNPDMHVAFPSMDGQVCDSRLLVDDLNKSKTENNFYIAFIIYSLIKNVELNCSVLEYFRVLDINSSLSSRNMLFFHRVHTFIFLGFFLIKDWTDFWGVDR